MDEELKESEDNSDGEQTNILDHREEDDSISADNFGKMGQIKFDQSGVSPDL